MPPEFVENVLAMEFAVCDALADISKTEIAHGPETAEFRVPAVRSRRLRREAPGDRVNPVPPWTSSQHIPITLRQGKTPAPPPGSLPPLRPAPISSHARVPRWVRLRRGAPFH